MLGTISSCAIPELQVRVEQATNQLIEHDQQVQEHCQAILRKVHTLEQHNSTWSGKCIRQLVTYRDYTIVSIFIKCLQYVSKAFNEKYANVLQDVQQHQMLCVQRMQYTQLQTAIRINLRDAQSALSKSCHKVLQATLSSVPITINSQTFWPCITNKLTELSKQNSIIATLYFAHREHFRQIIQKQFATSTSNRPFDMTQFSKLENALIPFFDVKKLSEMINGLPDKTIKTEIKKHVYEWFISNMHAIDKQHLGIYADLLKDMDADMAELHKTLNVYLDKNTCFNKEFMLNIRSVMSTIKNPDIRNLAKLHFINWVRANSMHASYEQLQQLASVFEKPLEVKEMQLLTVLMLAKNYHASHVSQHNIQTFITLCRNITSFVQNITPEDALYSEIKDVWENLSAISDGDKQRNLADLRSFQQVYDPIATILQLPLMEIEMDTTNDELLATAMQLEDW